MMRPMSKQYGLSLLLLLNLTTIAACGDNAAAPPPDAGPGVDAGPDAPGPDGGTPATLNPAIGHWRNDFSLPGAAGNGSRVEAIALAAGGDKAYIGGIFSDAAGVPARNVAEWTGSDWAPLGAGLDGWVRALHLDAHGSLWAGVTVTPGFTGSVQQWDGAAWTEVGAADGPVIDLAVIGDTTAVVGNFTTIGDVATAGIAYHDATGWHAAGAGATDLAGNAGTVTAIAPNGTGFCVAGSFDRIGGVDAENAACWDGAAWAPLGTGLLGGVAVLARGPDGTWYAGGTLTYVTDPETNAYAAGIAALHDNVWAPLDGGIDNGFINEVRAIAFAGSDVLIGGCFETARGSAIPARFLARWSPDTGWSELAGGLINDVGLFLPSIEGGDDLAVGADGSLWIGGLYTRANGAPAVNIARMPAGGVPAPLVGTHPILGTGGFVDGLAVTGDGQILVGGGFAFTGQVPSPGFAKFDGTGWTDLGNGLSGIVRDVRVRADGAIAVSGQLVLDGEPVVFAQRTATGWSLPGGAVHGVDGLTMIEQDGVLWLGGDFTDAGGLPVQNLIRLDGDVWSAAGAFDDRVTALTVFDGAVVAGGLFSTVDGTPIRALARRDGDTWVEVGSDLAGRLSGNAPYVNALASSPTLGLIVGGNFDGAGPITGQSLLRWDGQAWHDVGGGIAGQFDNGFVSSLLVHDGGLFVAGSLATAGSVPVSNLAWYDGAAWHDLGGGLQDLAEAMVISNGVLYIGGPFTEAGGRSASGFAAWDFRTQ